MRDLISISIVVALLSPLVVESAQEPVIAVKGPTVLAFFPAGHITDGDSNEALSDFQFYAGRTHQELHGLAVEFQEIYAPSFRIKQGTKITAVHPEQRVGYYLFAPGRRPRIEYGVRTDEELLRAVKEYFGLTLMKDTGGADCARLEPLRPNLEVKQRTIIRGHIADGSGAPFRNSPIELRLFVSESKQTIVSKVSTDNEGAYDLGTVNPGDYRLLLSPNRGFKQPERLDCWPPDCTLENILEVSPTDSVAAACPVR